MDNYNIYKQYTLDKITPLYFKMGHLILKAI